MGLSIFLAKLIGIYMLIVALIALLRRAQFESALRSMIASEGVLAISGLWSLVLGIAILVGHPIWELNWRGLVTLFGVLAILQGIVRVGFTSYIQQKFASAKIDRVYWVIITVLIIVGAYLTYSGFKG